jgi:hypothetical protein
MDVAVINRFTGRNIVSLLTISKALEKEGYSDVYVQSAKVSIVRAKDYEREVEFDIWVNEEDGVKGSKIIHKLKMQFKEVKYMGKPSF